VKHCTEEDLILYYYEERPRGSSASKDIVRHLDACEQCAAAYRDLAATLKMMATPEAPERGDQYGLEVWQRIRHQLPEQDMSWWSAWFRADRLALVGAVAVLLLAAFVAGRWWSVTTAPAPTVASLDKSGAPAPAPAAGRDEGRDRILLATVADHLDRSERVLTDIMNAPAGGDISTEQRWAEDLVAANRLYRQDAVDAGEHSVAVVLDELERNLLEIVHTPSRATAARLDETRRRIDAASLLFKVRVLGNELRQREQPDAARPRALAMQRS
jgi:hypothetical protein